MDTLQWASVKEEGLNHEYYIFRVFRAFRGLNDFYYSCPLVSIRGSIIIPFVLFVVSSSLLIFVGRGKLFLLPRLARGGQGVSFFCAGSRTGILHESCF